jgi:hypothetical protein
MSSSSSKKTHRDRISAHALREALKPLFAKHFKPLPLRESKRRRRLVNLSSDDLTSLQQSLRDLQNPYGETFWRLEQFIAAIDDELKRRRA